MKNTRKITALGIAALLSFAATAALAQHDDPHAAPHAAPGTQPATHIGDPAGAPHGTEHGADHPQEHAAGEPGAEHGGHGGGHGPEPINWTNISDKSRPAFFALVVNFGLLATLYFALGKKPVASGLKQRRIDIGKDIDEASKMLAEAKALEKKHAGSLQNADVDAETAKGSLVSAGKGEVERLLADAEEKAARMKRDAERLVEQEQKQLRQDLLVATIEKAVNQAHKMLEQSATPEDHARLANELLAELAKKPAAPRMASAGTVPPRTGVTS